MIHREEFIEDVKIGDLIRILSEEGEILGNILSIRKYSVKLETEEGESVIQFDRINLYTKILNKIIKFTDKNISQNNNKEEEIENTEIENSDITEQEDIQEEPVESNITGKLYEQCQEVYQEAKNSELYVLNIDDFKSAFNSEIKRTIKDDVLKKDIEGILDSFADARKNRLDYRDSYKMEDILKKTKLMFSNNYNNQVVAFMLATLLHHCKSDSESVKYYAIAEKFESACALEEAIQEDKLVYAAEIIYSKLLLSALWVIHELSPNGKWAVYEDILLKFSNYTVDEKTDFISFLIASMLNDGKIVVLPNTETLCTDENIEYLLDFMQKYSDDKTLITAVEKYNKIIQKNKQLENHEPTRFQGIIDKIGDDSGFINCLENNKFSFEIYFNFDQVSDPKLKKMLMCESGINYKVSFNIGINKYGRIAAFNIKLLDLPKIQDTPQEEEMDEGYITEYDSFGHYGKIQIKNSSGTFQEKNILDPYLKIYLNEGYFKSNNPKKIKCIRNSKKQIEKIISFKEWTDEEKADFESRIPDFELKQWNLYKNKDNSQIEDSTESDSFGYFIEYIPLDYLLPDEEVIFSKFINAVNTSYDIPELFVAFKSFLLLYLRFARKNKFYNDALSVNNCFIFYLRGKGLLTKSVDDLLNIYAEIAKSINISFQLAISLIKSFKIYISNETYEKYIMNIAEDWIDYYYGEIESTNLANHKLYYILEKANLEFNVKKYKEALESCELFYQQKDINEVFKVKIDRIKCISLYMLGEKDKAKDIANNLIVLLPQDKELKEIVNDVLKVNTTIDPFTFTIANNNDEPDKPEIKDANILSDYKMNYDSFDNITDNDIWSEIKTTQKTLKDFIRAKLPSLILGKKYNKFLTNKEFNRMIDDSHIFTEKATEYYRLCVNKNKNEHNIDSDYLDVVSIKTLAELIELYWEHEDYGFSRDFGNKYEVWDEIFRRIYLSRDAFAHNNESSITVRDKKETYAYCKKVQEVLAKKY